LYDVAGEILSSKILTFIWFWYGQIYWPSNVYICVYCNSVQRPTWRTPSKLHHCEETLHLHGYTHFQTVCHLVKI